MKSLILVVWGWCPHLSCYVSELFEIPSTSCHSTKNNCFSQVCNLFFADSKPLLYWVVSNHFICSLHCNTRTEFHPLSSVFLYFHPFSHLSWKYSSLSVCVLFLFPSSCFWNPLIAFLSHISCSPSCMFLSVIFFFSYISPSNSHSFFHICTPKPLKSSPILTLISWLPGVDHLYHPAIRFFCQHTTETAILKDICLMHSFLFSAHRYHYLMILRFLDFCSTGTWFSYLCNSYCFLK